MGIKVTRYKTAFLSEAEEVGALDKAAKVLHRNWGFRRISAEYDGPIPELRISAPFRGRFGGSTIVVYGSDGRIRVAADLYGRDREIFGSAISKTALGIAEYVSWLRTDEVLGRYPTSYNVRLEGTSVEFSVSMAVRIGKLPGQPERRASLRESVRQTANTVRHMPPFLRTSSSVSRALRDGENLRR